MGLFCPVPPFSAAPHGAFGIQSQGAGLWSPGVSREEAGHPEGCVCVRDSIRARKAASSDEAWPEIHGTPPPQRGRHDPDASPSVFQSETLTRFCGAPTKPTNDADLLGLLWPWSYRASPTDLFLSLPDCSLLTQALRSQAPLLSHPLLASTLLCLHSFRH